MTKRGQLSLLVRLVAPLGVVAFAFPVFGKETEASRPPYASLIA